MDAAEKSARNIFIRKFHALVHARTLENAIALSADKELMEVMTYLRQTCPHDLLIKKRGYVIPTSAKSINCSAGSQKLAFF